MDWIEPFYTTRSRWFGPTGIFAEHRARAADVERLCGPGAKRILELGAGGGGTAAAMVDLGYTVVAVELSPVRAQFARDLAKSRPNLTVLEADFYSVDLQGRFDVVCYWDGFGVGRDDDQRRLLQRVSREWLDQTGAMLLDVFSPPFWASLAGQQERIETVSRLVDGDVQTVRLDVPVIARYAFDRETCQFISEWWPEGREEEKIRESVRCYTSAAFVELLVGTGLVADVFEVAGKPFDPRDSSGDASALLTGNLSYRVRLKCDAVPGPLCKTDPTAANRELLQQIIRVFETGDVSNVDALIDVNYVDHQGLGGTELRGQDGFRRVIAAARAAMPSLQVAIEELITNGDRLVTRLRWCAQSAFGQVGERQTLDILRVRDGRLAEHWGASVDAPQRHYRSNDWIDPRIEIRPSPMHGRGMFATAPIGQGEVVAIWGGTHMLTEPDLRKKQALAAQGCSLGTIGEGLYLVDILDAGEEELTNLLNHSCDPNLWMHDEVTLGARRDIAVDEELTLDYAMIEDHEDWVGPFGCQCGSELCRGRFTGKDWRREDIQARYSEHFSPFINERIRRLRAGRAATDRQG